MGRIDFSKGGENTNIAPGRTGANWDRRVKLRVLYIIAAAVDLLSSRFLVESIKGWTILIEESIDDRVEVNLTNKPLPTNRRLGPRRVTDVKVFASDGIEIKKCRLRDISLDGAFIETKNFALAKGSIVDLVLRIRRDGETSACRVPAKVVRTERSGAALMFASLEEDGYNVLLDIVNVD